MAIETFKNINDLAEYYDVCPEDLSDVVFRETECGAWLDYDADGIEIGSIVEGSDAEVEGQRLNFPFTIGDLLNTLSYVDFTACELFCRDNYDVHLLLIGAEYTDDQVEDLLSPCTEDHEYRNGRLHVQEEDEEKFRNLLLENGISCYVERGDDYTMPE